MRIISGELGGRRFHPPTHMPYTRPTTDIAKEGLFNILQNNLDFEAIKTLDLFGGTGSISYELASRGVTDLTVVVEKDQTMFEFIKKTAKEFNIENLKLIRSDVFKFIQTCSSRFDFIFAGPPYALTNIDDLPRLIIEKNYLKTKAGLCWNILPGTITNNFHFSGLSGITERRYFPFLKKTETKRFLA